MNKNLYKLIAAVIVMLIAMPAMAQKNLDSWMAKCEKEKDVTVTVIKKKNPETGKMEKDLVTVAFKKNDKLLAELLSAAKKDIDDAYEVIETRKGGVEYPQIYRYRKDEEDIQYIFSIEEDTNVSVVRIIRAAKKKSKMNVAIVNKGDVEVSTNL